MKLIERLEGYTFVENPGLLIARQVRFPRSKRRRIRRKWALRRENNEFAPSQNVHVVEDGKRVIAHPVVIARLRELLDAAISERAAATSNL